jgi:TrmH family RNA methyltransferase
VSGISKNKIKWVKSLHQKKFRDELGLYLVEGEKMVQEAILNNKTSIHSVFCLKEFEGNSLDIEHYVISLDELNQISTLKTPNKVLAVLRKPEYTKDPNPIGLTLVLDGVQDPGNMGTILRIADWFGIKNIVCSKTTVECYNPKVVQASMGSIFRTHIYYEDLLTWLMDVKTPIYGALLNGTNVYSTKLEKNAILLMGNEGQGISSELLPLITHPIMIPRFGSAESLNVSVATGILVSEFFRNS